MRYRSVEYADDLTYTDPSEPSTKPEHLGSAFRIQTTVGTQFTDPTDDRVTQLAGIDEQATPYMRSLRLGADLDSTGDAVHGGVVFNTSFQQNPSEILPNGNVPMNVGIPTSIVQSYPNGWYDTLRSHAGYPLPQESDIQYAMETGDVMPHKILTQELLVSDLTRIVPEKPQQWTDRLSREPAKEQAVYPLWARALGRWEWSGIKAAQDRPIADTGPYFTEPLHDGIPSNSGAAGAMSNDYDLNPRPLTFRAPPTPWDIGYNSENGRLVDSGY